MNYLNNENFRNLFKYAESYQKLSMELRLPNSNKIQPVCVVDNGFQYKELIINEFGDGFITYIYDKSGKIKEQIKNHINEDSVFIKNPKSIGIDIMGLPIYEISLTTKEDVKNKYGEDVLNKLTPEYSLQKEKDIIKAIEINPEVLMKLTELGIDVDEAKIGNFITDKSTFILKNDIKNYINVTKDLILDKANNLIKQHLSENNKIKP